jgi:hypothetical protein
VDRGAGLVILIFYWTPLTSPNASIQWDAVDTHYSPQKYFSERLRQGELPYWTPYPFSGFPFLADPQVGACAYGLSGFFAGHSSHVGIFQAASWLPWLLLCLRMALDSRLARFAALGGLLGGLVILAGHLQTALYAFAALALYAAGELITRRRDWWRAAGFLAVTLAAALLVSAIQTLPALELTAESIRAGASYGDAREGVLEPRALPAVLFPDALGVLSGNYHGPGDITQYRLYAGILLVPLALAGLGDARTRLPALLLIVPAAWYMLGPAAGLYRLGALLPAFHKVRAPIHGWFVVTLGLALLAAAGIRWTTQRWKWRYLGLLLSVVFLLDLCYWNSWKNPLTYARASFDDLYGNAKEMTRKMVAARQPPRTRFEAPERLIVLGPLNHPLDLRLEATYGYNPLKLAAYDEYVQAISVNPKLRDGLSVSRRLDLEARSLRELNTYLPRAYFAREIIAAASLAESRRLLRSLDPARQTMVAQPHPPIRQDAQATASIVSHSEQEYRIRYRAASPSLLRLSVPHFPRLARADRRR